MIGFFLNEGPVTNFKEANASDHELFRVLYRELAVQGIFFTSVTI